MADSTPTRELSRREPAIRTMRSDISEFLRTTKPSLVSILARQVQEGEYRPPSPNRLWLWLALAALAAVAAGGGFWYLRMNQGAPEPAPAARATPAPFVFFETTNDTAIAPTRQAIRAALTASGQTGAPGSFQRIIVRLKADAGGEAIPDLSRLLAVADSRAPTALAESVIGPPQLFRYQASAGPEFGLMAEARNPARALQSLLAAEPSLARDFDFLFAGNPPPLAFTPYQDLIYRNTSFRYLNLDPNRDRGLGYLLFPARRLIVMATSEATMRTVIDRLFETR
ncbi:MAG: hypothetical protein Q8R35_01835 [bacterium]|nr:hypothetical protein [bacterium]